MIVIIYFPAFVTGHLSIALTEIPDYISFYPPNWASEFYFRFHDLVLDGKIVTKIAVLPSEESIELGPSEKAIAQWKEEWLKNPMNISYGLFNNRNCSSVVYRALRVGQQGSQSMNGVTAAKKTWWMDTPDNVFNYASELGRQLLKTLVDELIECCELGKNSFPYTQAMALYVRLKKFTKGYSLTLTKPFCESIKATLETFQVKLHECKYDPAHVQILKLADTGGLEGIDIDAHFSRLRALADHIYQQPANIHKPVGDLLQGVIRDVLLFRTRQLLNSPNIHILMDEESIKHVMDFLESLFKDKKLSHPHLVQLGSKVLIRPLSSCRI